ncbi:MAG TPA: DUF2917 domain-containing protein [Burkholderiaceae bacterium]|jgi:hypothetical protein
MGFKDKRGRVVLQQGQVMRLGNGNLQHLICREGTIWVTQDGDVRDVILNAGQCMMLDRSGVFVLSAFTPAQVVLRDRAVPLKVHRGLAPLVRRILEFSQAIFA